MAKLELFTDHGKLAAFFLRQFGAFPVKRDSADPSSVKNAVSLLEDGEMVGIFPQGGCVPPHVPFRAKAGVAMLAQKTKAPILPVWITYEKKKHGREAVKVQFGKLIPYLETTQDSRKELRSITKLLTERMNQLGCMI